MSSSFPCSGPNDLPLRVARRPALPAEPSRLAAALAHHRDRRGRGDGRRHGAHRGAGRDERAPGGPARQDPGRESPSPRPGSCRSEEHTSELQSHSNISYAVFCLKKKKKENTTQNNKTKKNQPNPTYH